MKFEQLPIGARFHYVTALNGSKHYATKVGPDAWLLKDSSHSAPRTIVSVEGAKNMNGFLTELKTYLTTHRDLLFTIILVVLLDHFLFDGALRAKLRSIVDNFLDRQDEKIVGKGQTIAAAAEVK